MKHKRGERLDSEYRREISKIVSGVLKDREPDLKGIVSVTEADVAPDLKTAKIYVSIFASGEEEKKRSFAVLQRNAAFIRHELARVMTMRTVPALTFYEDGSMEYGSKMDALFAKLDEKREAEAQSETEEKENKDDKDGQ